RFQLADMDVQSPELPGRLSLRLDVYSPPQVLQIDGRLCHLVLAFLVVGDFTNSRAPSLHGRYPASTLLRTHPSPSRLRSTSRLSRLYDRPCSDDFSSGRGGLLQLLGMSLSPCCRFHPAEVLEPHRSDFGSPCCLRPPVGGSAFGATHFRGHFCVHCCYGPVTRRLPTGDVVDRLQSLGFPPPCYPNYGVLIFAPAGLSLAEHASLRWTHNRTGEAVNADARGISAADRRNRAQNRNSADCWRLLPQRTNLHPATKSPELSSAGHKN